jgi:rhodanese-related sulfurtransferase
MGLGKLLLFERLRRLNSDPAVAVAVLNTSQFCARFLAKMGFVTLRVVPNGYFTGMDKHEMSIRLPWQLPAQISN